MFGTYSGLKKRLVQVHVNKVPSGSSDLNEGRRGKGGPSEWHSGCDAEVPHTYENGLENQCSSESAINLNDMCGSLVAQ